MPFNLNPNVSVDHDRSGVINSLEHLQQPYVSSLPTHRRPSPRALATQYLHDVAHIFDIPPTMIQNPDAPISEGPTDEPPSLRFIEEKTLAKTTVVSFQQTVLGLPIWEAGVSVSILERNRAVSSYSSVHTHVDIAPPSRDEEFLSPLDEETISRLHGLDGRKDGPVVNHTRLLVYRYQLGDRPAPGDTFATLPIPPVLDNIVPGRHYVVREILFTYSLPNFRDLNWRAFAEVKSGAILYLQAMVADAQGYVYTADPLSQTGAGAPSATATTTSLNAARTLVTLPGVTSTAPLKGELVDFVEKSNPVANPPSETSGNFLYDVNTDGFSAVEAYYHVDKLFRMVRDMGYDLTTLFDGTGFPIHVDFSAEGDVVNAHAIGNTALNGLAYFQFGIADTRSDGSRVSIADEPQIVAHEFSHALLLDCTGSYNFAFAHSAGDSIGVILNDPSSEAPDRFLTFPWVPAIVRRHDRDVTTGWAWGGTQDGGGYDSEQILSTTLFRLYRSIGGDSGDFNIKTWASQYVIYLIVGGIASLPARSTNPTSVVGYVNALMQADADIATFGGQPGGAIRKIVRWAFEKQGLYQPPGAVPPFNKAGVPDDVDVYIDDGRQGEYQYQPVFWETTDIWNRLLPDGQSNLGHQNPVIDTTNYAYVRVKNRGTKTATNIVVSGYHCRPSAGLTWPDDWTSMDTASLPLGRDLGPGETAIAGPFEWVPSQLGHECMLMSVSALGDISNNDTASGLPCATGPTPHFRLVPFDNNIAQRNVAPVAGGGGAAALAGALNGRHFWINNPYDRTARATIKIELPPFLVQRKWEVKLDGAGEGTFNLGPRANREVIINVRPGAEFSARDVGSDYSNTIIRFTSFIDGLIIGGMSYAVDPTLRVQPPEHSKPTDGTVCKNVARDLLDCFSIPAGRVRSVRTKRITIEIDLDEDCGC